MPLVRLTYFSENQIDPTAGSVLRVLGEILNVSNKNNQRSEVTGALVFDDQWFVQVLEGERFAVWATFDRILEDSRHADVVIAEVVEIKTRIFANWWMDWLLDLSKRNTCSPPFSTKDVSIPGIWQRPTCWR